MTKTFLTLFIFIGLSIISCTEPSFENAKQKESSHTEKQRENSTVYQSEKLIIEKLSEHVYRHISYLDTDDYGKVACNGMLIIHKNKAVIFDTPTDNPSTTELITYIKNSLKSEIRALIPGHFHEDCVGGIQVFEEYNIPIYISEKTAKLLKKSGQPALQRTHTFNKQLSIRIGGKTVYANYFGEGHTADNIVGYFPEDQAIFGGCLVKHVGASKGYLGDANTAEWAETVRKVKSEYPKAEIVIPGHGKWGGTELFDYTIDLFEIK
jgi:metallo-beta-lactamase class B